MWLIAVVCIVRAFPGSAVVGYDLQHAHYPRVVHLLQQLNLTGYSIVIIVLPSSSLQGHQLPGLQVHRSKHLTIASSPNCILNSVALFQRVMFETGSSLVG